MGETKPQPWERFRLQSTWRGNVSLNFMGRAKGEFDVYGHAFHEAANRLVDVIRQGNGGYSDLDACPIVTLYRHAIELHLKAILYWGEQLLRLDDREAFDFDKIMGTHNLEVLLPHVKNVFAVMDWVDAPESDTKYGTYAEIEEAILEINEIDRSATAFRFPIDKKGNPSLPEGFHFNVIAFGEEIDALLKMLDGAATGVYVAFQDYASYLADYAGDVY